jgi:hypothetical protein
MKGIRLTTWLVLLGGFAVSANAQELETLRLTDAAWVKAAGDRLARCAGTYRGAAEIMRHGGREQAATYAESVASGALFAAYLLLTSPTAVEAKVLDEVHATVHIDALAWGTKRNFIMMETELDPPLAALLRSCTQTSTLQSLVLRGSLTIPITAAEARAAP